MPAPIFINVHNQNARTFALVALGLTYLFFGAAVFHAIEKDREVADNRTLREEESELQLKYNISKTDMEKLETVIIKLEPYKSSVQWDFPGSLYFAIIVLTTIGYGHSVPRTVSGKIFCMFYSLIGVPLYLVMFQAMGERINNAAKYSIKKVGRKMGLKCSEVSLSTLVPFGLFSCALTVTVGTLAFSYFERWSLLDSGYYCVVTLTTVGFGDYVPLQNERSMRNGAGYVVFSFIYILLGLTIIGAFVNLVVLRLMVTTATGEPPKEEETQVDTVCEPRGISTTLQTHSRTNSHDVEGDSGTGNGGISLPGMNGNIKYTYSRPHSARDDQRGSSENPRPFQRRQQSFTTPREQQYGNNSRSKKSRYSDSEIYGLYNEMKRANSSVSTLDNNICGFQNLNSGSQQQSRAEISDQKNTQKRLKNGLFTRVGNGFSIYTHSENGCVICQQSCPVCHQIFSLHMLTENTFDSKQRNDSKKNDFKYNNNVNNSANTMTTLDDVTNRTVVAHCHTNSTSLSPKQDGRISLSKDTLRASKTQSSAKMLLDPNQANLPRPRNLSMDSGYEGMLWEKSLERSEHQIQRQDNGDIGNAVRGSHTSHFSKNRRWSYSDTLGTIPRPSFLALPSSKKSEQDANLGRTTSTFAEHDLSTDDILNKTVQYRNSLETGFKSNRNESVDDITLECTKKTLLAGPQTLNDEKHVLDTKNFERIFPVKDDVSQPPAIVVTMCGDENRGSNDDPGSSRYDNSTNGYHSHENVETRDKPKNNNIEGNTINKMCEEHYQKYKQFHRLIHDSYSKRPSPQSKKNTEKTTNSIQSTKAEVLPTTKLCSNGSVVTNHGDVMSKMSSFSEAKFDDSPIQRSHSCGNSDRSQSGANLFNSLRQIRIKNLKENGAVQQAQSHLKRDGSEKQRYHDFDSESDIVPIFINGRRRKKNKFDLFRVFLSNHKQNGHKEYDISTVFKDHKSKASQDNLDIEMKLFGGSDPSLVKKKTNPTGIAASTLSLPHSITIQCRENGNVRSNGDVCT